MVNYKRHNKKYKVTVTQGLESNNRYLITPVHTCTYSANFYLFLLWLLYLELANQCLIVVVKVGRFVLFLVLGNAFSFSPLRIMFAVGLSYMAFAMLR